MQPLISLEKITKHYAVGDQNIYALDGVELNIMHNEYVAITGASGSGKSTMMNILGCLDKPSSGDYILDGNRVSDMNDSSLSNIRNRKIGFIFQNFNLISNLSAIKNVIQPLVYHQISEAEKIKRAQVELERVGLTDRAQHLPSELSGGQRQRVAIARALVSRPSLLLADEPTGNLDSKTSSEILKLFDELHHQGQTVVMVTHDEEVAQRCGRRVTLKDGRIHKDIIH